MWRRAPDVGEEPLFVAVHAAPTCRYGSISPGVVAGWICVHVASRIVISTSERTLARSGRFRQIDLSRAPAATPPSAPLHVAHRRRVARGRSHHAAARQREGGERVRAEARRLDRGAAQAFAEGGAV